MGKNKELILKRFILTHLPVYVIKYIAPIRNGGGGRNHILKLIDFSNYEFFLFKLVQLLQMKKKSLARKIVLRPQEKSIFVKRTVFFRKYNLSPNISSNWISCPAEMVTT